MVKDDDDDDDNDAAASENSTFDTSIETQPSMTRSTHVAGFSWVLAFALDDFPPFLILVFWLAFFFIELTVVLA